MEIHKKILLLITIIIASIILYRLWARRIQIKLNPDPDQEDPIKESFANISVNEYITPNKKTIALNQYCIKSSWNTAYTSSNTMDLSMVDNVIRHGCRFLDFEIYSISDTEKNKINQPEVGFSIKLGNNMQTDSKNTLPLYDVIHAAIQTNNKLGNRSDPMFIQLRVKSGIMTLYKNIISVLESIQSKNLSIIMVNSFSEVNKIMTTGKSDSFAKMELSKFKHKIVFIADLENSNELFFNIFKPENFPDKDLQKKYMTYFSIVTQSTFTSPVTTLNSVSNSKTLKLPIRPPVIDAVNIDPVTVKFQNCLTCAIETTQFTQSFPDFSVFNLSNPLKKDIITYIIDYGINILPMRYYIDDNGLADYDTLFGNYGFVTISEVLLNNKKKPVDDEK